ncbi:MAG: Mrr restriction system protein [Caldilineaceae bacterium]|nr:Mrr restriction system protein [Caldilineaceae bacterium]
MASNALPTFDAMMQPALEALRAQGGQATNGEIYAYVIQALEVPAPAVQQPHRAGSSLTELEYRLQWTRTYLREYGLIENVRRGVWRLTEAGWQRTPIDRKEVVRVVRRRMAARRAQEKGQAPIFASAQLSRRERRPPASAQRDGLRSPTPFLPAYANARSFLHSLDGVPAASYHAMASAILEQRGTPQEQVDWSDPNAWIAQRLDGPERELAEHIWSTSQQQLNPRYTHGCWYFATKHDLLARDREDILRITSRGRQFMQEEVGPLVAELDAYEGILTILRLVAGQETARRGDLLPGYGEYSRTMTTLQSDAVIKSSLSERLRNLADRALVTAQGRAYEVTEAGLAYLERYASLAPEEATAASKESDLFRLARAVREEVRGQLSAHLLEMDALIFEELVKLLLEEMGYDNVMATAPATDKGVDLVGTIELGISSVRELIQARRHRGSINRPALDQLRGSLHRFNAVRGTIITTGRFSKGVEDAAFERGAAPITLIDGEKLLDLLLEHEIGVRKRRVDYFEFAPEKLAQLAAHEESDATA